MKTAAEFFDEGNFNNVTDMLIEFAKMHVLKIKHLQQSKYYSGETGYIKSEEWENIINNIK
jgi:hypothetical protein